MKNNDLSKRNDGKWIIFEEGKNYDSEERLFYEKLIKEKMRKDINLNLDAKYSDVYIYFTKDDDGNYTNPRIYFGVTHSNENNKKFGVFPVYGIDEGNMIEGSMIDILDEKLKEFQDYNHYKKTINDMKLLNNIEKEEKLGIELSRDELIFLHGINYVIDCFGYDRTKKLKRLKQNRDIKKDLAKIFYCKENNVGIKPDDFDNDMIEIYYGDLYAHEIKDLSKLHTLKTVIGDVGFRELSDIKDIYNIMYIYGNARFDGADYAETLENLVYVRGDLHLKNIEEYNQLKKLEYVGGCTIFHNINKNEKRLVKGLYQ